MRRALDIALSLLALVVLSPLLVAVGVAVAMSSPGPIIFSQARVGQGGRPFRLHKFRSMHSGGSGPGLTLVGDPRVTRLGHLLRSTSIDELPQLFNVLRGEMTLVGARPESLDLAVHYPPSLTGVFWYRPGLTGPAQLRMRDHLELDAADVEGRYLRELVPIRVKLDMAYLRRPTLLSTLGLIWQTAAHVLLKSGARLRETSAHAG